MKYVIVSLADGSSQPAPTNVRLSWNFLTWTNDLAYCSETYITQTLSFIRSGLWGGTVVEHSAYHLKVEGSNLSSAAVTGRE